MHCAFVVVAYDICTPCVYSSAYTAWHWHKKNHYSNKLLEFLRIFALVLKMTSFYNECCGILVWFFKWLVCTTLGQMHLVA